MTWTLMVKKCKNSASLGCIMTSGILQFLIYNNNVTFKFSFNYKLQIAFTGRTKCYMCIFQAKEKNDRRQPSLKPREWRHFLTWSCSIDYKVQLPRLTSVSPAKTTHSLSSIKISVMYPKVSCLQPFELFVAAVLLNLSNYI